MLYFFHMYTTATNVSAVITTTFDIDHYIKVVSTFIDRYVGYKLAVTPTETPKTLYFDGTGTDCLPLNKYVLKTPNLEVWEGDNQFTTAKMYPLNEDYAEMIKVTGRFAPGNGNIELRNAIVGRYVYDWTTPANHTLPVDIEAVCTNLVVAMIKQKTAIDSENSGIVKSETMGAYSITYQDVEKTISSQLDLVNETMALDTYKHYFIL